MQDFIPDEQFKPDQQSSQNNQFIPDPKIAQYVQKTSDQSPDFIPESNFQSDSEKYGGVGQQVLSGIEGLERGATLGTSDYILKENGIDPGAIKARAEENPVTSFISGAVGSLAPIGLIGKGLSAIGVGSALAPTLAKGAIEGGAIGAGNVISESSLGDPDLNAQKVISQIGLGSLIGLGAGALGFGLGKFGLPKGSIAEEVEKTASAENLGAKEEAKFSNVLNPEKNIKANAPDVIDISEKYNLPLAEGMVSSNPWVQKAEDALISGRPTFAGSAREALYREGYNGANKILDSILPSKEITKNQLGDALQDSFASKISAEAEPFEDLYNEIKQDTKIIPLNEKSAPSIARNITDIINDPQIGKNSPSAKLGRDVVDEIGDLKTVDDLRGYQSGLNQRLPFNAPPAEKRIISIIQDKLDSWERRAIQDHANKIIKSVDMSNPEEAAIWGDKVNRLGSLLKRIDDVDAQYAPFKQKISELSEWLGKGKTGGAKDAISFIKDRLEPEDLVNKLTSKKYAKMYSFLEKNFPQESAILREYQKSVLKEAASKTGEFSPKIFFNKVNSLEPEIQNGIFHSDEITKIKDMEKYLRSFPKSSNPSGTSHTMALRDFFSLHGLKDNAVDAAMLGYVKTMGALPEGLRPNPIEFGSKLAKKANIMSGAAAMASKTHAKIDENISHILGGESE